MHLSDLEEKSEEKATFLLLAAGQPSYGNVAAQSSCREAAVAVSALSDPSVPVLECAQPWLFHVPDSCSSSPSKIP